jgi:hypothetical protein
LQRHRVEEVQLLAPTPLHRYQVRRPAHCLSTLVHARRRRRACTALSTERVPYSFKEHTDTRVHIVAQGDTL